MRPCNMKKVAIYEDLGGVDMMSVKIEQCKDLTIH